MADSHHGDVLATMRNGVFSDLTFVCKQQSFQVHKALVCAQSDKLYSEIESAQVTSSGATEIDMSELQPETVESFVTYLYTGEYYRVKEELAFDTQPDEDVLAEILSHLRAHHIAFRYEVDRMMSLSLWNLQSLLEKYKGKKSLVSALPAAARVAYSLVIGHDVKDSLAASFAWHLPSLAEDRFPDIYTIPEFFELVLSHCARKIASHKDLAAAFDKRLQAVTAKNAQDSMAANEALQLVRDRKHCASQSCRADFNVQVSNTC
ncbi:BTB/POZ fold domain containing protein [Beauveria brongniartii RCEF 3172]|uniref:BTB/POZ fold domain containing protein n=1 Tax=Beauveria brongniartii RCEF 3172 TaxID=1081107 RepID=A0A167L6H8_9HYPO|nr:BTB/POZ fold domain containing protein [Beauveria brongniartii RCEF 3172]